MTTRPVRAVLVAVVLAGSAGLTGCATKADIRDIRSDLTRLEERQDSIYRLLQQQNRAILDSLTVTTERLLNVRGELANELLQLRDQVVQVGDLTAQVQVRLTQLDQQLATAMRAGTPAGVVPGAGGGEAGDSLGPGAAEPGGPDGAGGPAAVAQDAYEAGLEQLDRGNAATARRAFQLVVDSFPTDPVAPDAQRQIGETYVLEGRYDAALDAFDRVVERYQQSQAAPRALYRAGVIAQERGQLERAREYFRRLINAYPNSDARRLAETALDRIG